MGEQPGQDFFRLLAKKLGEYHVETPTVQIEYKNLTVKTTALVGTAGTPTAGNFGLHLLKVCYGVHMTLLPGTLHGIRVWCCVADAAAGCANMCPDQMRTLGAEVMSQGRLCEHCGCTVSCWMKAMLLPYYGSYGSTILHH